MLPIKANGAHMSVTLDTAQPSAPRIVVMVNMVARRSGSEYTFE